MTEKRFILIDGVKKGTHSGIWDNLKQNNQRVGDELWVGEVVAMLNEGIAIVEENEQLKHDATVLIQANQDYRRENEQLKTTISRLIEQNRKNNDLLVSDIRLLEKALWCPNCTINIKRLRELKKEFEK